MIFKESDFSKRLKKFDHIMIFGAKKDAHRTFLYIQEKGFDIEAYLVSSREGGNPCSLDKKPVKIFEEISPELKQKCLVIISQSYDLNDEMVKILVQAGFKNVIAGCCQMLTSIDNEWNRYYTSASLNFNTVKNFCENQAVPESIDINVCVYAVTSHVNLHKTEKKYCSKYINYI